MVPFINFLGFDPYFFVIWQIFFQYTKLSNYSICCFSKLWHFRLEIKRWYVVTNSSGLNVICHKYSKFVWVDLQICQSCLLKVSQANMQVSRISNNICYFFFKFGVLKSLELRGWDVSNSGLNKNKQKTKRKIFIYQESVYSKNNCWKHCLITIINS